MKFYTCHESTAVVSYAKFCSNQIIHLHESETKFTSNFNCDEINITEMGLAMMVHLCAFLKILVI